MILRPCGVRVCVCVGGGGHVMFVHVGCPASTPRR